MNETKNEDLTPENVKAMPLAEFEQRFCFRPADRLEKHWFAVTGKRIDSGSRAAVEAGLLGQIDLNGVRFD